MPIVKNKPISPSDLVDSIVKNQLIGVINDLLMWHETKEFPYEITFADISGIARYNLEEGMYEPNSMARSIRDAYEEQGWTVTIMSGHNKRFRFEHTVPIVKVPANG